MTTIPTMTTRPPKRRRFSESVKAFLLGPAYNGDGGPGREAGGTGAAHAAIPAPAHSHSIEERSKRSMYDDTAGTAKRYPHITAEVLLQFEEEGLTVRQTAERLDTSRSTIMKLRHHYGLTAARPKGLKKSAPTPVPAPEWRWGEAESAASAPAPVFAPPPAIEVKGESLSTLPIAPFELHQRGRFSAARLARILRGHADMLDAQEGEFHFALKVCQEAGALDSDTLTIESAISPKLDSAAIARVIADLSGPGERQKEGMTDAADATDAG